MIRSLFLSLIAVLATSSAFAVSDLACSQNQKADEASANVAALLSRGYTAAGRKYISDGGGIDGDNKMVYSEHMNLGDSLRLTHAQINRVDSYSLAFTKEGMTDQDIYSALVNVSNVASKTLSADDAEALQVCNQWLGWYVGVVPNHP